jgi:hypothetical protein
MNMSGLMPCSALLSTIKQLSKHIIRDGLQKPQIQLICKVQYSSSWQPNCVRWMLSSISLVVKGTAAGCQIDVGVAPTIKHKTSLARWSLVRHEGSRLLHVLPLPVQ